MLLMYQLFLLRQGPSSIRMARPASRCHIGACFSAIWRGPALSDLRDHLQESLGTTYRLGREIAGGGMSRVFVAEERALYRRVVFKVLVPDVTADLSVERFKREILFAAQLQHPHIVPVLSARDMNGLPSSTRPLVDGDSLPDLP